MAIYFSPKTMGFYSSDLKDLYDGAGTWPKDAKILSDENYKLYSQEPPEGKKLGLSGTSPAWVDTTS